MGCVLHGRARCGTVSSAFSKLNAEKLYRYGTRACESFLLIGGRAQSRQKERDTFPFLPLPSYNCKQRTVLCKYRIAAFVKYLHINCNIFLKLSESKW
jgi:hypothetical protein